jgi:ribonuclease E
VPPVVILQAPDLGEPKQPGEQARGRAASPAVVEDDEADFGSGASRRRRRGGRGRGKGGSGGDGQLADEQPDSRQAGADRAGSDRASTDRNGTDQGGAGRAGAALGGTASGGTGRASGGRGKKDAAGSAATGTATATANGTSAEPEGAEGVDAESAVTGSSRRRRRRRQRGGSVPPGGDVPAPDEPADTVIHIREPRVSPDPDDVRAVKGSTRLEAKRQRRRESRDGGRRRPPIISESEFLARREAVERVMVVRQQGDRTQIAVLEDGVLVEHYVDKASHQSYVGNVYLGKVQNVLPSMEAAFVDIGKGRNAVLYAGEVNFDATGLEGVAKRIESALKSGQSIMVQVTKDPIGHKGARLTSQVSLPGRYLVYVPGAAMTGISRKLPDTERTRLKQILKKVAPEEGGIIVRTAAEGASEEELLHDVTRLVAQWQAIERKAKSASAPDLLYAEPDLTIRVVRDIFNEDFTKLVIASDNEWDLVDEYVRYVAPTLAERLDRWADEDDLFSAYRVDEQLAKALDRKVWLPSGGSLVIDTTEAMTVIDVNTGKFTGQGGNLEQTVTRNNLEAAEEIVRQLRLRDIGGIIVMDFIDMVLESNRDLVLRRLIECLARDRTKHQVAEVTSLGLVQMTRKRVGSGLLAALSVACEECNGRGVLVSTDLTELGHQQGRNGQRLAGTPKPGPGRTRSARSKAIAQVAAKTLEGSSFGGELEDADVEAAEAVEAEAGVAGAGVANGGPALVTREQLANGLDSSAQDSVLARGDAVPSGALSHGDTPDPDGPYPDGQEPPAVAADTLARSEPRRRVRRSAHRDAGPPDGAVATEAVATEAVTAEPVPTEAVVTEAAVRGERAAEPVAAEVAVSGEPTAEPVATEAAASAAERAI